MNFVSCDVAVIGGGPAGLAAALSASEEGANTILIEREAGLGGILKQCIHDGFGLVRFGEKLTGPEYAHRFTSRIKDSGVETYLQTFVTSIKAHGRAFILTLVNNSGITQAECGSIVIACGCRERTSRQIGVHGKHCAGVLTAGTAQYYTNILGKMPTKRCVILGSGDIGLIMARRLTLEGAEVVGVYEAKDAPSGLVRNVYQCLEDFDIPLHTGKTVTRLIGNERLGAVEISDVDENMAPIDGTEEIVECDALILSVGLIPENELSESLGVTLDSKTGGPFIDKDYMTDVSGVFCCGNALYVHDLVDYVSETGEAAGRGAARYALRGQGTLDARGQGTGDRGQGSGDEGCEGTGVRGQETRDTRGQGLGDVFVVPQRGEKQVTCIVCPIGCRVLAEEREGEFAFSGNRCPRGAEFTLTELTAPMRSLTTTVRTVFPEAPVLSVRTNCDVPKGIIPTLMRELSTTLVSERIGIGEAVICDISGIGCEIIATSDILK